MSFRTLGRRLLLGEHSFRVLVELPGEVEVERFRDACTGRGWATREIGHGDLGWESPIVEVELSAVGMRDSARDIATRRIRSVLASVGVRGRPIAIDEPDAGIEVRSADRAWAVRRDGRARRPGTTVLATVDQAEVDRHYGLAKRVWSLPYAPHQRPRVIRKTLNVDEAFAVGIMAATVAPFVLQALWNLMPPSGLPQVSVSWLWPGGVSAAALAFVPWIAGRVIDVVAQRTDRRFWWRLHGILEPAGLASVYVVSGMLGFIGLLFLVGWLAAFFLPVAAVVMALFCGFFGAVALRSVSNESLRRFLGWIIPLGLTAMIPFVGDHLLSIYLLPFGLTPTDVKVGLSDMVLSGAVGVGLLLLAMVFVVAAWGAVRRMGASAASTAPFAVALLFSVALLVPFAGFQAYVLTLKRAAAQLPWFGVVPTSVCVHPIDRDKPVPFEGTPPPFDRPVMALGHADGRYALWDPEVRLPSKVISSAVSLVPSTSCRGTGS